MIIIGCQRSGLMTCAEVFRLQHEVQFTPYTSWQTLPKIVQTLKSEASWLAVPFIKTLVSYTNILHIIRHPLKVIGSMEGLRFWNSIPEGQNDEHKLYRDFIYKYITNIKNLHCFSSLEQSMIYWLCWNHMCEGFPRLQIESFSNVPQLNKRKRKDLDWIDLPDGDLKTDVIAKMEEYGYE